MGLFSLKKKESLSLPKELLDEKVVVSVTDDIPNKKITKFVSAVFADKTYIPTMRKPEEHFTKIREEAQYLAMQQAMELGANALVGFSISFAPYNVQGSKWGGSIVVASGNEVVVE